MTRSLSKQDARLSDNMKDETLENIIAIAIVIIVIALIFVLYNGWLRSEPEDDETIYNARIDDDPLLGDVNAPITIIEFSDFSCTYCAAFATQTKPALEEYIEEGTVRFVFRDYPLTSIHPKAIQVAKAAGCAHEQEKFWEYHDVVYQNITKQEIGDLRRYAQGINLNMSEYEECFASDRRFEEIQRDIIDARELGVAGTPTFFISGKRYTGFLSFEEIEAAIIEAQERVTGE